MRNTKSPTASPRVLVLVVLSALALLAASCTTSGDDVNGDEISIVVTTSIWADVVSNVAGSDANVETIIPVGADAHDFAPSSQQVAAIQTADLVVANGLGLEEMLEDVLAAAEADGVAVLELAPAVDPIPFAIEGDHHEEGHAEEGEDHEGEEGHAEEGEDHEDEDHAEEGDDHAEDHEDEEDHAEEGDDHDHAHEGDDPHVWMDPDRVAAAALLIGAALAEIDSSVDWMTRAEAYAETVTEAGNEADSILSVVGEDQRKLVTNHEALGYLADRFGFEVVGVVFPGGSTLSDPSSGDLAELVATMQAEGVRTIFGESSAPSDLAEAVAAEVGDDVEVVEIFTESLGEEGSGAETVLDMITTNAELIAASLSR